MNFHFDSIIVTAIFFIFTLIFFTVRLAIMPYDIISALWLCATVISGINLILEYFNWRI